MAYDGTDYHGWQRQPGQRTVQGVLESALRGVFGVDELVTQGAGRTDAGVHARGQVASFAVGGRLPATALAPVLRRRLPADLRVLEAREAPTGFDARRSARARRYAFRLARAEDPLLERFAWRPRRPARAEGLERATRALEGEHDFSSFRSAGSGDVQPVCRVHRAGWRAWEGGLMLDIVADHFLYHMVRSIVGTALEAAEAADPAGAMRAVLAARERAAAGPTAPAHGLCLEQVFYAEDIA